MDRIVLIALVVASFIAFAHGDCNTDLLVILDNSGSVQDAFIQEKEIAAKLVETDLPNIGPTTNRVALFQFNQVGQRLFTFNQFTEEDVVAATIRNVTQVGGNTNVKSALELALDEFNSAARKGVNKVVLLITDGNSFNGIDELITASKRLNDSGITVVAASASDNPSRIEFAIYTLGHFEHVFTKENITQLASGVKKLLEGNQCAGVTPSPTDANTYVPPPLKNSTAAVPPPTQAPPTTQRQEEGCPVDLLVIIDNSGSVEEVFPKEKETAAQLVEAVNVSPTGVRVAYVQFATNAKKIFPFNQFADDAEVAGAIRNLTQEGGNTNVAEGLRAAYDEFQAGSSSTGSRKGVRKYILLITDGNSQNTLESIQEQAKKLNSSGVTIFAASNSPSDKIGALEFPIYTDGHTDRVFLQNNLTSLVPTISGIIKSKGCSEPIIETTPQTATPGPVTQPQTQPPTQPQTQPPTEPQKTGCVTDFLVIIDNSGSVQGVFDKEKEIAAKLVEAVNVSPTGTRVAYVQFNSQARTVFPFNKFAEDSEVAGAIRNLTQEGGNTNVVAAFTQAAQEFSTNGRRGINYVALIITDGNSQNLIDDIKAAIKRLDELNVKLFVATASEQEVSILEFGIYVHGDWSRVFRSNNITQVGPTVSAAINDANACHAQPTAPALVASSAGYAPPAAATTQATDAGAAPKAATTAAAARRAALQIKTALKTRA